MLIVIALLAVCLPVLALNRPGLALAAVVPLPVMPFYGLSSYAYIGILLVVALAALPTEAVADRSGWRRSWPLLAFSATLLIHYLLPGTERSVTGNIVMVGVQCGILAGAAATAARPNRLFLLVMLATAGTWYAIVALADPVFALDRTSAVLGQNANGVGFLVAVGLVAALTLALLAPNAWLAAAAVPAAALCGAALLLTSSLTSGVAAVVGTVAAAIVSARIGPRWRTWTFGGVALVGLAMTVPLWNWLGGMERSSLSLGRSLVSRSDGFMSGFEVVRQHPMGVGLARAGTVAQEEGLGAVPTAPHNAYLGIAAEVGLIGLAVFLVLLFMVVRRLRRRENQILIPVAAVYLAGGFAIEWPVNAALGIGFWVLAGTALASTRPVRRPTPASGIRVLDLTDAAPAAPPLPTWHRPLAAAELAERGEPAEVHSPATLN